MLSECGTECEPNPFVVVAAYGGLGAALGAGIGAGIGIFIGTIIGLIFYYNYMFVSRLNLDLKKFYKNVQISALFPIIISMISGLCYTRLVNTDSWWILGLSIGIYTMFFFWVFWFFFFRDNEKKEMKRYLSRILNSLER